jgi:hypothetical protein
MIPPLDGTETFEDKADVLRRTLFPTNNPNLSFLASLQLQYLQDLSDIFTPVNPAEIYRALRKCDSNTACGHDQIGHNMIKQLHAASPDLLLHLITAILKYGVHHTEWKKAICVVIPKHGKDNYKTPKSYRPISLLPCLGKLVERIASTRIMSAGIQCGAISEAQFGGRPDHSAIDALIRTITPATDCFDGPSTYPLRPTIATHDIMGAFNNTHPDAVMRIMVLRRMPAYLIGS